MDKKSLAVGILVGVLIVGCMVALDDVTASDTRYQFPIGQDNSNFIVVLDTDTGTVNYHYANPTSAYTLVMPFQTQAAQ